jgi:hypothetical protein
MQNKTEIGDTWLATHLDWPKIQNIGNNICWQRCEPIGTLSLATLEDILAVSLKIKYIHLAGAILEIKIRALHLLGMCSTAWAKHPALYTLVIFEIRSHFLPKPVWTIVLLFYTSHCYWDDRHVPRLPLLRWGFSQTFLPGLVWNYYSPDLSLLQSLKLQVCTTMPSY